MEACPTNELVELIRDIGLGTFILLCTGCVSGSSTRYPRISSHSVDGSSLHQWRCLGGSHCFTGCTVASCNRQPT